MKNKKWNPKEWQGRTQKQVESSGKVMELTVTVVLGALVLYGLFSLTTYVLG